MIQKAFLQLDIVGNMLAMAEFYFFTASTGMVPLDGLRLAADGPEGDPGKPLQRETGRLPRQLADFEIQGAAWSRAALLGYNGGAEDKL